MSSTGDRFINFNHKLNDVNDLLPYSIKNGQNEIKTNVDNFYSGVSKFIPKNDEKL
jgi:hypothetical protein